MTETFFNKIQISYFYLNFEKIFKVDILYKYIPTYLIFYRVYN